MKEKKQKKCDSSGEYMAPESLVVKLSTELIICLSTYSIQELEEGDDVFTWQ
jgi:hypothetical protein